MSKVSSLLLAASGFALLSGIAQAQTAAQPAPKDGIIPPPSTSAQRPTGTGADAADISDAEKTSDNLVVITGSRIPRPEFSGIIPGVQVGQESIQNRGFTNLAEAIRELPGFGFGAQSLGNAGGQPSSYGVNFLDLLGLGTQRTLTLVNGRRFVSGNAGSLFVAGNNTGSQVDINTIPTSLTERVDVLTVGGAAAYGSDAIAGVINIILKDNFKGVRLEALGNQSSRNDARTYRFSATAGMNFAEGRGNITGAFEYIHDDPITGDQRDFVNANYIAPTFFRNGGVRNPNFAPQIPIDVVGLNNGAFLRASDDGQPGNRLLPLLSGGSILVSPGGTVFQYTGSTSAAAIARGRAGQIASNAAGSGALISVAGNTQIIPGVPISAAVPGAAAGLSTAPAVGAPNPPAGTFTRFAPTGLPAGVTAQQVISALAPNFTAPAGTTAAQLTTLAVNLLQANRPTPREYFAANPNTPINNFLGSFVPAFLDVPNTGADAAILPRTAVPLRFSPTGGDLQTFNPGSFDANTPATLGGSPGGDFFNPTRFTTIRAGQDRYLGNLLAHIDVTDHLRVYTENSYAKSDSILKRNQASANSIASATVENAALLVRIDNPYLTDAQRQTLLNAGVSAFNPATPGSGLFVLSRTNQDIFGDNPFTNTAEVYRSVIGTKGDFKLFGREFQFDTSFTYGRADGRTVTTNIKDIEYALAIDVARDNNGTIVCAAKLNPSQYLGTTPPGINPTELVRNNIGNGRLQEQLISRRVTQAQIDACQPLNPFGFNQMSDAAKQYVRANVVLDNTAEQYYLVGTLSGSPFDLPGGPFRFALTGEYRQDSLDFRVDDISRIGGTRTAALTNTTGRIENIEGSIEVTAPITGDGFLPWLGKIELNPAVRFVKQDGSSPDVQRLNGTTFRGQSSGDVYTIWTLGGTWKPIRDITIRGNVTRSIRQPSVVELFLGGQSAFTTPADPCSNQNINAGVRPATRRANCIADVIRLGIASNATDASNFLNTFVASGQAIQGVFSGSPGLKPERGESFTFGAAIQPRWVKGLTMSADYIDVTVRDQIIPTAIGTALQNCYDSTAFPDTSREVGVNTCNFFQRVPGAGGVIQQFNVDNGFSSGFINLGGLQVQGINASIDYRIPLTGLFGPNAGRLELYGNMFHYMNYYVSNNGTFNDRQQTAGSFFRPEFAVQGRVRYRNAGLVLQWNINWASETQIFSSGAPITNEIQDVLGFPDRAIHDFTIGYDFKKPRIGLTFVIRNAFDTVTAGLNGLANSNGIPGNSGFLDPIGRRFTLSANWSF
ncbi:MAG: TonB-dependent receptor [Sphingomonadaceae bacterium]|nr:TonB-dependent receptor [Sphingomonadaceae bacterium]